MTDQPMFLDTSSLGHPLLPIVFYLKWLQRGVLLRSVAREIAALAHSSEHDDQAVGRRAAMAVTMLHSPPHVSLVCDPEPPLSRTVDEDLLLRAANEEGRLCTEDRDLQEQARQQHVEVISIQSFDWELAPLAAALAAIYPPLQPLGHGHLLRVRIEKGGYQPHQGVPHLADGRRVVVNGGARFVGQEIDIQVQKVYRPPFGHETIFAVPVDLGQALTQGTEAA